MKNKNGLSRFLFLFPNLKTEKEIWEYDPLYLFLIFIRNIKKEKTEKQPLVYMPSFAFPSDVFGICVLYLKHWQKRKNIRVIHASFTA